MTPDTNKERTDFDVWWQEERRRTWIAAGCHVERGPEPSEHWSESYEDPAWAGWQARAAKAPAAPTGWYALAADGMATLCVDRDDAEKTAADSEKKWPNCGPYRAVQLYTAPPAPTEQWMPIADAPEGEEVVVGWLDPDDTEHPARYDFDMLEDGGWVKHAEHYEHYCCVAKGGDADWIGPGERAPYTHWKPLGAPPDTAAKGQ